MAQAYVEVPLYGQKAAGRSVLVDPHDHEPVAGYRWNVWHDERKSHDGGPYAIAHIYVDGKRTTVYMHTLIARLIVAETKGAPWEKVDHESFDGLDNRRRNLRDGTKGNTHNQRPRRGGTSEYKGVAWNIGVRRWVARITIEGKTRHLGCFDEESDAAAAYNDAAIELFGSYAHLNVVRAR